MARMKAGRHQKKGKTDLPESAKKLTGNSKSTNPSRPNPNSVPKTNSNRINQRNEDLKKQIHELGGNEDDFKLLENADSDIEIRESKAKGGHSDATLSRDVSKFMKELNFSNLKENSKKKNNNDKDENRKNDIKIRGKSYGSAAEVNNPSDMSKRDRKTATNQLSKTAPKEKMTKFAEVTKPESAVKPKHIIFSENGPEMKIQSSSSIYKTKFIVDPSPHWYATASAPPLRSTACPSLSPDFLEIRQNKAQSLLHADAEIYSASSANATSASDAKFMSRILSSGTLSDRLSALTLMVQASPSHNTRALESLKGMAGKKGREESLKALRAIVDWWIGGGAPNRKLKYFRDQPLTHPDVTDAHLVIWFFEDWLKKYFFSVLQILESLATDPLPYVRKQAMHFIFQLLRDKPEQEHNLLRLLVHKLNDSDKSIASKASYHLLQILQLHPQMKKVLVQEITGFILRPTIANVVSISDSSHTQKQSTPSHFNHSRYYAAITFNQMVLTSAESEVAELLINVYFELFKEILGHTKDNTDDRQDESRDYRPKNRKGYSGQKNKLKSSRKPDGTFYTENVNAAESDHNAKLTSAILTGVNRALPFVGDIGKSTNFASHINTLFRITHASTTTFAVSLQSLMLLLHVCTNPKFSSALSIPSVPTSLSSSVPSNTESLTSLPTRFFRTLYTSLFDSRLSHSASSSKHAIYLNLLLKSVKSDLHLHAQNGVKHGEEKRGRGNLKEKRSMAVSGLKRPSARSSAITKRYLQTLASGTGSGGRNEIVCAGLFFVGELMNIDPGLMLLIDDVPSARTQIREARKDGPSDETPKKRRFNNLDSDGDGIDASSTESERNPGQTSSKMESIAKTLNQQSATQPAIIYDPKKRDPQYANAEYSALWELIPLQSHYHPSVALHARQLLTHSSVTATPDLGLNTISHFLDRFVYRNAKKKVTQKGISAMQRIGNESRSKTEVEMEVNTDQFRKTRKEDVPVDQIFFHNFFTRKHDQEVAKGAKADKRKRKKSEESDIDEVVSVEDPMSDDEKEKEIWNAMRKSIPQLNIGDDDDSDGEDEEADVDEDEEGEEDIEKEVDDEGLSSRDDGDDLEFMEDSDDLISETGSLKGLVSWGGNGSESESGSDDGDDSGKEWEGFGSADNKGKDKGTEKGRKRGRDNDEEKKKKKRRTGTATFASYDDYLDMIENAQEDNI